jgi:4'-phosphopantetheinyl transferase
MLECVVVNIDMWDIRQEEMLCLTKCCGETLEEQDRIFRFVGLQDRKRSLMGKLLIRYVISTKFSLSPMEVTIKRDSKGKPLWACDSVQFDFNVSHHGKYVILASTDQGSVGCDVFPLRYGQDDESPVEFLELMNPCLSSTESCALKDVVGDDEVFWKLFGFIWSAKEAFLKMTGEGLIADLCVLDSFFSRLIFSGD